KAERRDVEQVFGVLDLGSGVAFEGEHGVVAHHAAAIVGEVDELAAAAFHLHAHAMRAGVERVLEQLLDDAGRPLHHFARGDLVGDVLAQYVDAAHACRDYHSYAVGDHVEIACAAKSRAIGRVEAHRNTDV